MSLTSGDRLAGYDVIAPLGAGGMGEVYRARDRRLGRDVAIKVLPPAFSDDPDRLARFEREARVLASLNHPHIAAIYGVEEADRATGAEQTLVALVLELVEGPTLAERLSQGALPVDEVLGIARQLAGALEAAHENGIVHRDLKPANIKLTRDGAVKVLDFGLAKAFDTSRDLPESPTLTAVGTRAGVILGTAAYMSPEQARGQTVDKRTDIWAFGCVVYEMLTGQRAFPAATTSDAIAAVLERQPDWTRLPAATSPGIRRLLRRCLAKDLKQRFHDIGDVRIDLEDAIAPAATDPRDSTAAIRARRTIAGLSLVALAAAGMAVWSVTRPATVPTDDLVRFTIPLPAGETLPIGPGLPPILAISPDGEQIVFAGRRPNGDRLYLRRRQDLTAEPLAGSEGGIGPFFSPDGQWIGFASGGALKKMPIAGGAPQTLAPAPNFRGASWGPDDTIVYTPDWESPLLAISANGGSPRPLTTLNTQEGEIGHLTAHVLPGATHALFGTISSAAERTIEVAELGTGRRQRVVDGRNPFYLSGGLLVFARAGAVFVAPFDVKQLALSGPPVQVLGGVRSDGQDTHFAVNRTGTLAYVASEAGMNRDLVRVDRKGGARPFTEARGTFSHPRISPDGTRVVVQAAGEIWIHDVSRDARARLRVRGSRPIWAPDGRSILVNAQGRLYSAPIDDSSDPQLVLAPDRGYAFPLAWSQDGSVLVYSLAGSVTGRDVWMLRTGDSPTPFLTTPRDERAAMFSPDGRWVVYAAKEPGREEEVYVQPYPGPGDRIVVSRGGGIEPVWSPTGGEIFYRSVDGRRMMAVEIQTRPTVSVGIPSLLFEGSYPLGTSFWSDYDVWPDGNEFLMVRADETTPPGVHVVVSWLNEVRRRLALPE